MHKSGLVSATFRNLIVEEIIDLAVEGNLSGIEWGSDIHVVPGEFERAREVSELMRRAGLESVAYGSYYRVGEINQVHSFRKILETAIQLEAPAIRVWAGKQSSYEATVNYRSEVIKDVKRISRMAKKVGLKIYIEYHGRTLTDTPESAQQLMEAVAQENVFLYWQTAIGLAASEHLNSISGLSKWLAHVHVFHWEDTERLPLLAGESVWETYMAAFSKFANNGIADRYFMLEFVKDDDKKQFLQDAHTLNRLLAENTKNSTERPTSLTKATWHPKKASGLNC